MTLGDLSLLVQSGNGWKVFKPPRFPRPTWFPELIQSAEVSRNTVAHMNPLQPRDVRAPDERGQLVQADRWSLAASGDEAGAWRATDAGLWPPPLHGGSRYGARAARPAGVVGNPGGVRGAGLVERRQLARGSPEIGQAGG
jgi:hypothetical protein